MSRPYSRFTREDEKELFKEEDVNPNFLLDAFRSFYINSTESCSVDINIALIHATVDEIEGWEPNEALVGLTASYEYYSTTLKLPDNVRKLSLVCDVDEPSACDSEKTFLDVLSTLITSFQFQDILLENPNKYKCATCQKSPVTVGVWMVRRAPVNDTTWSLHVFPCFPVCDSAKCDLIATKCIAPTTTARSS
jgi:hypothetical protein